MKIYEENNKVIVEDLCDFEPKHIFECGQCFRWYLEEDGSYTGVVKSKVINVKKEDNKVYFDNTNLEEFHNIWYRYFDLDRDYNKIKEELKKMDKYLNKATDFGHGIRILQQDEWETLISFIISANNRIPMIKKAIENLSSRYGEYIGEYRGKKHYSFPTPDEINKISEEDIRACKTGFRAQYIKDTAYAVISYNYDLYKYKNLDTDMCRKELLKFSGVGPKVCDCIALFSMQKHETFPVDIWVKRVMQEFYVSEDMSLKKMRDYAIDKFKGLSGFAQQYLFYYARELGIGRE